MEEWNVNCSDDEFKEVKGPWEPALDQVDRLYTRIEKEGLEISWKCPGYKVPSPEVTNQPVEDTEAKHAEDKSDFDFLDESTSPTLKMRKEGEDTLKGSAKKKVTSLDGVINNMRRHKLIPLSTKDT